MQTMTGILLKNAGLSGVYRLPAIRKQALIAAAAGLDFVVLEASIPERCTTDDVLVSLGAALHFPIWYGANFDALFDCLTDPDWQPAKGHLLLITGLGHLRAIDPDNFATMIDVLLAAADARRQLDSPFWILIDTPARGVSAFPEE